MYKLMSYRCIGLKCVTLCLGSLCLIGCFIVWFPTVPSESRNPRVSTSQSNKKLAILVPFQERFEELLDFVPHMYKFLNKQSIPFHIFVVQQKDNNRFNRASLINVGFIYTRKDYDYIAMHDVDLLPLNDKLSYKYPENGPCHISAPQTHPRYHYKTFIGGILLLKREDYEMVNGMSNIFWGWGLEDDEFYVRLKDAGLKVRRPAGITTGIKNTFRHLHENTNRIRDMRKCYKQREITLKRDRRTGVHDVAYNIISTQNVSIDYLPITFEKKLRRQEKCHDEHEFYNVKFNSITVEDWRNVCLHAIEEEKIFQGTDEALDMIPEQIIINTNDSSDESENENEFEMSEVDDY